MVTKEEAKAAIEKLVQKYIAEEGSVKSPGYKEEWAKENFIGPLFRELGWDVGNRAGKPFQDQEVQPQARGTKGTPDYAFKIGRATKFLLEAKKPSESLPNHVLQAKQYAWNSGETPVAVLTNFDELLVYRVLGRPTNDFQKGRIERFFHNQYVPRFDELWALLSREAVEQGSLDAALRRKPEPKEPVSDAFLKDLEEWRADLAKDLHKSNPGIDAKLMTEVVQRMLDRLVFIRIAEDRGIIEAMSLEKIAEIYRSRPGTHPGPLQSLFKEVNEKLNGDIFKPHAVDEPEYRFDPTLLVKIIASLYDNHYRFDVIKVELLGTIYERYLGSVIRLTEKRVKVEEKPEVRKAGGVFYTPKYIVDYIVENTVGKLIAGKTPAEIEKIRILDPACGSGSFLLGAYQKLIDYHIQWYSDHRDEAAGRIVFHGDGGLSLTLPEKARILKNNIHGVDIDQQAVEITMMSLYVKALEGERVVPQGRDLLPRLSKNIICGNSLIGTDAREVLGRELTGEEARRVNGFDWKAGFADIFGQGGFDAVIGNPPYIRIQAMQEWAPVEVEYLKKKYKSAESGNIDIYLPFVEKGVALLKPTGKFGFILPHKFFQAKYGENLRRMIAEKRMLEHVVNFRDQQVFEGASTYTCLMFLTPGGAEKVRYAEVLKLAEPEKQLELLMKREEHSDETMAVGWIPQPAAAGPWNLSTGGGGVELFQRLKSKYPSLEEVTERIFQGLKTSADKIYIFDLSGESKNLLKVHSPQTEKEYTLEKGPLKPLIKGGQMRRYHIESHEKVILFPYQTDGDTAALIDPKSFGKEHPHVWKYLEENKRELEAREEGRMRNKDWYAYIYPKSLTLFDKPKLVTPDFAQNASFSLDEKGDYYFTGGAAGGYGIIPKPGIEPRYLLALLNSKLLDFLLKQISTTFRGGWFSFESRFIKHLPIRPISPSNPADKKAHDDLVRLVDHMLELHKQRAPLPESAERERIEREIAATDGRIDEIVYRLYGVTEEERKIVEGRG